MIGYEGEHHKEVAAISDGFSGTFGFEFIGSLNVVVQTVSRRGHTITIDPENR